MTTPSAFLPMKNVLVPGMVVYMESQVRCEIVPAMEKIFVAKDDTKMYFMLAVRSKSRRYIRVSDYDDVLIDQKIPKDLVAKTGIDFDLLGKNSFIFMDENWHVVCYTRSPELRFWPIQATRPKPIIINDIMRSL